MQCCSAEFRRVFFDLRRMKWKEGDTCIMGSLMIGTGHTKRREVIGGTGMGVRID
jgi:hypothetical protein